MKITFCAFCDQPVGPEHVKEVIEDPKRDHPPLRVISCPEVYGDGIGTYELEVEVVKNPPMLMNLPVVGTSLEIEGVSWHVDAASVVGYPPEWYELKLSFEVAQ